MNGDLTFADDEFRKELLSVLVEHCPYAMTLAELHSLADDVSMLVEARSLNANADEREEDS
jgi:hypothetical protein